MKRKFKPFNFKTNLFTKNRKIKRKAIELVPYYHSTCLPQYLITTVPYYHSTFKYLSLILWPNNENIVTERELRSVLFNDAVRC